MKNITTGKSFETKSVTVKDIVECSILFLAIAIASLL